MANYSEAYDFDYFAPKPRVETEPEREGFTPRVVVKKAKTKQKLRTEQRLSMRAAWKAMAVAVILFAIIGGNVYGKVVLNERVHQLETIQTQIDVAESENIRLNNELNGSVSLSEVEKVATSKYHMVKKESSQVTYVDVGDDTNCSNAVVS
jgi:hypothetical protein